MKLLEQMAVSLAVGWNTNRAPQELWEEAFDLVAARDSALEYLAASKSLDEIEELLYGPSDKEDRNVEWHQKVNGIAANGLIKSTWRGQEIAGRFSDMWGYYNRLRKLDGLEPIEVGEWKKPFERRTDLKPMTREQAEAAGESTLVPFIEHLLDNP